MVSTEVVGRKIDEIEREMRRIGFWQNEPPPPELFEFTMAFAMDTMAYSQWLQFILVPRVRGLIEEGGGFPARSQVGLQALREFDGIDEAADLIRMLTEFDALFC